MAFPESMTNGLFKLNNFNPVNYEIKISSSIRSIDRTYSQLKSYLELKKYSKKLLFII
jgi:hypothetical protein